MFLKSLQLQGFKSFPDRVVIDFVKGVTAIVGPNGSGKSNISDSVRWVLGEQGSKVLRIKNTEELIFSGTVERKAQGFAEVVLTIDNKDRELSVDADEVAVLRRYYRSGKSEYKINGENVRLQDINELFFDTGLGKNGYSLIGQGKVSAIVEARSDERRMIFEEAAGISKYRSRRNETERNLKKTEENLTYLQVMLSGLEEQVGPLEKESVKAKKYLELKEEREKVEIGLWLYTLGLRTEELRDLDYNMTLLNSQVSDIERQIDEAEKAAEKLMDESNALSAKKDDVLRTAAETEEKAIMTESDAALLKNDIGHNLESIRRLEEEYDRSSESGERQQAEIEEKENQIKEKTRLLGEAKKAQESVKSELDGIAEKLSGFSDELRRLTEKQNELTLSASEARVKAAGSAAQIEELHARETAISTSLEAKKARRQKLEDDRTKTIGSVQKAEEKIDSLTNTVNGYRMRLDKQRARLDEARRNAESIEIEVQTAEKKIKMLEDLEKNMEGFGFSVKKVVGYSERGMLRGIHGTVAKLIDVADEYATAIETALGAGMQNIVVDNEENAKAAVNMLKRENAGRATFLPISTIRPRKLNEPSLANCDGYIGLGCELVECDEKYRNIIENQLGNVAIVEDMDVGADIARKFNHRFKIVTLDGQVFNAGGSITGGSSGNKNAGILSRKNEIEKLRSTTIELKKKAADARSVQKELATKAAADEASLSGASGELASVQEDVVLFRADLRVIEDQISTEERDTKNLMAEQGSIAGRCEELKKQQEEQNRLLEELLEQSRKLDEQMGSHSDERGRINEQRDRLSEKLSQIGIECIGTEKEIEALRMSIDEAKERIGSQTQRCAEISEQIAGIKRENTELSEKADALANEAKKARENAAAARRSVSGINEERMALEGKMTEKRQIAKQLQESRNSISNEVVRCDMQRESKQAEYDNIISKLLSEYDMTKAEAEEKYEPAEDHKAAQKRTNELRSAMKKLEPVNIAAIEQYKEVFEKYTFVKEQVEDVLKSKAELEKLIATLTEQMRDLFGEKFKEIAANYASICTELFGGGTAKMELTDPSDPLESGIDISCSPPGKVVESIEPLSGGEKTIIAVAIYFAIMKVNPSPFCILDEIDSALDEANVLNIANYVKRVSDKTQYIIITHRRGTMEAASTMYGVTMQRDGESKVLALKIDEVGEKLGLN